MENITLQLKHHRERTLTQYMNTADQQYCSQFSSATSHFSMLSCKTQLEKSLVIRLRANLQ